MSDCFTDSFTHDERVCIYGTRGCTNEMHPLQTTTDVQPSPAAETAPPGTKSVDDFFDEFNNGQGVSEVSWHDFSLRLAEAYAAHVAAPLRERIEKLKSEVHRALEYQLNTLAPRYQELRDRAEKAEAELAAIDLTLGNAIVFDGLTRREKVALAMRTARTAEALRASIPEKAQRASRELGGPELYRTHAVKILTRIFGEQP